MPSKTLQPAEDLHALGYTMKSARLTTGSIAAGAQAEVAVTWDTPFPGTAYTLMASVEEGTATSDTLSVRKIVSRTAAGCVVRVANAAAAPATGTLHLVAVPD